MALCDQNLSGALKLAIDTWDKKISFAGLAALVLIIAHGISFTLVHGVWGNSYLYQEFSVPGRSATIWVLLTGLILLIGYLVAILNCFVVFLFLDSINRKKDPEKVKQQVPELAVSSAVSNFKGG